MSSLSNAGTLKLNAQVTLGKDLTTYEAVSNGYELCKLSVKLGNAELGTAATLNGVNGADFTATEGVYTTTLSQGETDTKYHVVSGTVNIGDVATSVTENHTGYIVYNRATLDLKGTASSGQSIELRGGATLSNSGSNLSEDSGYNQQQIKELFTKL